MLTSDGRVRSMAFLSLTQQPEEGLKIPVMHWHPDGSAATQGNPVENQIEAPERGAEAQIRDHEVVRQILKHYLYKSAGSPVISFSDLVKQFKELKEFIAKTGKQTGTRIIIWNLSARCSGGNVFQFDQDDPNDIFSVGTRQRQDRNKKFHDDTDVHIDSSLRDYLSFLYEPNCDFKITLRNKPIQHLNIMDKLFVKYHKEYPILLPKLKETNLDYSAHKSFTVEMGLSFEDYRSGRRGMFIYWDERQSKLQDSRDFLAPRLVKSYHQTKGMEQAVSDSVHRYNGIIGQILKSPYLNKCIFKS